MVTAIAVGRSESERPYEAVARPYDRSARPYEGPLRQAATFRTQLDRYLGGEFESVLAEVAARKDFDGLLNDLKRDGAAWIAAAPEANQPKRRLAAATFALEAARAAEDEDWKWVQRVDLNIGPPLTGALPPSYKPADALWWKPPPLILEWACDTIRTGGAPTPIERLWHLAAIAVAQRRSDYEFLIGSPWDERGDPGQEIEHLPHVALRFPAEPRVALAQAIAMEWRTWPLSARHSRTSARDLPDAMRAFERQINDPTIGAEAMVRLGALRLRARNPSGALDLFAKAETLTRDRYLIYLARYFSGQARERQNRPADAERAYRGALATIPKAISATMALSSLLGKAGRMTEASALVELALTASPPPVDPWRTYAAADDRFWPELLQQLHAEIRR